MKSSHYAEIYTVQKTVKGLVRHLHKENDPKEIDKITYMICNLLYHHLLDVRVIPKGSTAREMGNAIVGDDLCDVFYGYLMHVYRLAYSDDDMSKRILAENKEGFLRYSLLNNIKTDAQLFEVMDRLDKTYEVYLYVEALMNALHDMKVVDDAQYATIYYRYLEKLI